MKIKWNYFSLLNPNFIVLCVLLMPCQLFAQKCSNCQEIHVVTKISKKNRSPPEHSAIGNIHRDILLLGIITLQLVIQNNCRWCFLIVWSTFWRSRKMLTNLPKLSCGFNQISPGYFGGWVARGWEGGGGGSFLSILIFWERKWDPLPLTHWGWFDLAITHISHTRD